ncbi:ppsA, partial [Symbiodinium pilosum]
GKVDGEAMPKKHFAIAGTFSEWEPLPMKKETEGLFTCSVTLGENRWEQFQIWLDGDSTKCLYPEQHKAPSKSAVFGPDFDSGGNCWLLDGRPQAELRLRPKGPAGSAPGAVEEATGRGLAGSSWKVRLSINGKWRLVDWERLDEPLVAAEDLKKGAYFITADFNGWGIEPMEQQADGSWALEVHLIRPGGQFQILRNRDSEQVLYPAAWADPDPSAVRGPDDSSDGRCWHLKGEQCDVFRVSFQRKVDTGLDMKQVSIERKGQKELSDLQLRQLGRLRLAAFGTWDRGSRLRELPWAGTCFHFYVQLGSEGRESFQLLE